MAETLPTLSQEFRDFLVEAKTGHGYGQPGANVTENESGGTEIVYDNGVYKYVDSFTGDGTHYRGYETISAHHEDKLLPVWAMTYNETDRIVDELPESELGSILSAVLAEPDDRLPIRGPRKWEGQDARYELRINSVSGRNTLENFVAEEFIFGKGKKLYVAHFVGGLANRHADIEATSPRWLA